MHGDLRCTSLQIDYISKSLILIKLQIVEYHFLTEYDSENFPLICSSTVIHSFPLPSNGVIFVDRLP